MILFIDLRGQVGNLDTYGFKFYSTISNSFFTFSGNQIWVSIEDFKNDYTGNGIEEFLSIIPSWWINPKHDRIALITYAVARGYTVPDYLLKIAGICTECLGNGELSGADDLAPERCNKCK